MRAGELPATGVSWRAARSFVARLGEVFGGEWRLPREIEWEYACRAGTTTAFSFGDNVTTDQVNHDGAKPYAGGERGESRKGPLAVRSLPPNAWGFYEMHGNVWEWCEDLYVFHPGRGASAADFSGAPRVIRGGAWTSQGKRARCGHRDGYPPGVTDAKYGFRVARSVVAPR